MGKSNEPNRNNVNKIRDNCIKLTKNYFHKYESKKIHRKKMIKPNCIKNKIKL